MDSMGTSQAAIDSIGEEAGKSTTVEKKMKKKVFRFSQEMLDYYLSFRPGRVSPRLIERDPLAAADMEKVKQRILTEQERMRREYEAKGYATYVAEVPDDGVRYQGEVTDDEEEEKVAEAVAEVIIDEKKDEDASAEVTADEKKEEDASAEATLGEKKGEDTAEVTEDSAAPLLSPQGRGRRRFRPGVVKQAKGGIKKIIM